jgi:CHAT domain/Domain of unknown function (DUF4062)
MIGRKIRVFVSSTPTEFGEERQAIAQAIASIPILEAVLTEESSPLAAGEIEAYLGDVRSSPIYVGLFGQFYSETARLEYLAADDNPYREKLIYIKESGQVDPLLQGFIKSLEEHHTIVRFRTLEDLVALFYRQLEAAVSRTMANHDRLGEPRPVAHSAGSGTSVLEKAWMKRQQQLTELWPATSTDQANLDEVSPFRGRVGQAPPGPSPQDDKASTGQSSVYPNIIPSSEHPVQGSEIDITVSLDLERRGQTVGTVRLPHDQAEHRIDVHLLFGTVSRWGTLTFQQPHGTRQPAKFEQVPVPVIGENQGNSVPESVLADITANFYLNNRWCGEGVLTIEILARSGSQPLAAIAQKQLMPWRKLLYVSPSSAPPDLLVRIQLSNGQLKWSLLSPHLSFADLSVTDLDSSLGDLPFRFVKSNFEVFTGAPLTDEQLEDLDGKCDLIYRASAPGFKKAYWRLFRASRQAGSNVKLESIQFVSDEPYIPWELMRVWDKDSPNERPELLGVKHAVGRWMAGDSCELRQELIVNKIAVCATSYTGIPNIQPLPWAEEERKYLQDHFSTFDVKMARAEVKTFLESGMAEVVHFSCHGDMSPQQPEDSSLELEDKKIKPGLVGRPETRLGIGRSKPLIFLNACQVGGSGRVLGLVFGWPQAFLNIGATACIAPLWSVIDENARDVAEDFYKLTLIDPTPKSLGQALQSIRQQWRKKRSLTYLGYVLYGDPMAQIRR